MRIAVASGKGGTGKTTVAVNLLLAIAGLTPEERPRQLFFLDCDVEEPNANLFLRASLHREEQVGILLPEVDLDRCTACGTCAEVCVYHAIAVLGKQVLIFPQLCHGCGSCSYNCPENAIQEVLNPTGKLEWGSLVSDDVSVTYGQGIMNVGEAMATPIIRELKKRTLPQTNGLDTTTLALLDAPPGNACPVVETLRDVDFALLVTEPTPFGLHDLRVAVELATEELGIPVGVVINRDGVGDEGVERFCVEEHIPILMRIPLDRRIAEAYAEGVTMVEALPAYREAFVELYRRILEVVISKEVA